MSLVPSLLQAIVRVDGDALVMHVGDKPYVVSPTGQVDLATRGLTLDAVSGIVNELLPIESQRALDELGAVQFQLPPMPEFPAEQFTIVAARGGDDVWAEIRRRRVEYEEYEDVLPGEMFGEEAPGPGVALTPSDSDLEVVVEFGDISSGEVENAAASDYLRAPDAEQFWPGQNVSTQPSSFAGSSALSSDSEAPVASSAPPPQPAALRVAPTESGELVAPQPQEPAAVPAASAPAPPLERPMPQPQAPAAASVAPVDQPASPIAAPVALETPPVEWPAQQPEAPAAAPWAPPVVDQPASPTAAPVAPEAPPVDQPAQQPEAPAAVPSASPVDQPASPIAAPVAPEAPPVDQPAQQPEAPAAVPSASPVDQPASPIAAPVAPETAPVEWPAQQPEAPAAAPAALPVDQPAPWPVTPSLIPATPPYQQPQAAAVLPPLADAPTPSVPAALEEPVSGAPASLAPPVPAAYAPGPQPVPFSPTPSAPAPFAPPVPPPALFAPSSSFVPPSAFAPPLQPGVVLPLTRNPIRPDAPPPLAEQALASLDRLLRLAAARGASTLYLSSAARPSVRVDGDVQTLDGAPVFGPNDVESLLLTLMPERNAEALRTGTASEWVCDLPEVGRVRCMSFRDHLGTGGVFRMMPVRAVTAEQLGLSREIQSLAIEPEGLVLVAGPRSSGKRTLLSALVDLVNRVRRDHVITIEREINVVHEHSGSLVSQREVRGGSDEMLAVARAALREDPDVLVLEDVRSAALMNVALEAASSGQLVIGAIPAPNATGAVDRIIDLYPPEYRRQVQLSLAQNLRGVVSQVLLRKTGGGRIAAREVLINTPTVRSILAEGKTSQLALAIEGGRAHGMIPLNDWLVGYVQNGAVDVREAYRRAADRVGFLALLKRQGLDTSAIERFA